MEILPEMETFVFNLQGAGYLGLLEAASVHNCTTSTILPFCWLITILKNMCTFILIIRQGWRKIYLVN